MKKFMLLLLGLPMLFAATSCDDDKDLPNVDITVDITGAATKDGVTYAVKGDTIVINNINITNLEENKPAAITGPVYYYWDGVYMAGGAIWAFPVGLTTDQLPLGENLLEIRMGVIADDKSPAFAVITAPVVLVATADDLPEGADPSQGTTIRDVVGTQNGVPTK